MSFSWVSLEEEETAVGGPVESWLAVFTVVGTVNACALVFPKLSLKLRLIAMSTEAPAPAELRFPNPPNPPNPPGKLKFPDVVRLKLKLLLELLNELLLVDAEPLTELVLAALVVLVAMVAGAGKGIVTLNGSGVLGSISPM